MPSPPALLALLSLGCAPVEAEAVHAFDEVLDDHELPGLAIVLRVRGERVFSLALGEADPESGVAMSTDTRVRIGSITKTMAGLSLAELDQRGVLDLDDPVETWVPGLPGGERMRVRDLVTHHSGLRNFQDFKEYTRRQHEPWSEPALLAVATSEGLAAEPGSTYVYSATGFLVAGMVLEAATGRPWHGAIQQTLGSARVAPGLGLPGSDLAIGHDHGDVSPASAAADNGRAAAALAASADDLDALLHALESGQLIEPAAWEEARFPHVERSGGLRYGLGVTHDGWRYGHRGRVLGYVAAWRHRIDEDATLVLTANSSTVSSVGIEDDVWEILSDYGYVD